ncbi:hypothetical protein [Clostridium hydrogenum]|uniref:hypothetical protein n=1 Tax=Clostridium hydrogenum TaxID=2855764 RepID=UPI001F18E2A8|nr:hypothetical protein [Clostridium hydrogenum]
MINGKLKQIQGKTKKAWLKANVALASATAFIMTNPMCAFAKDATFTGGSNASDSTGGSTATSTQITTQTPADVASSIFKANKGIAAAFGGALVGIAVVVIGIKMLMASKKQDARSEAMDSVLTVIIAALLIGGFAVFAGLFWGMGQ